MINKSIGGDAYSKKLPEADTVYVVDFFCGCGGMSWGFSSTRQSHLEFRVLAGIDLDSDALSTYSSNIGAPAIQKDIREIGDCPELLLDLIPNFSAETCRPLVFIGCAPCQGFSAHRKKDDRDDPRNNLMEVFAKLCVHYRPEYVVMENVPEIITGQYHHYYSSASRRLRNAGYSLDEAILDLSLFGVPQRRKRAVVIGGLDRRINLPSPIFTPLTAPTVRHAISHLSKLEAGESDPSDPDHIAPNHTSRILERIRKTPPDGGDRRSIPESDQLECHLAIDNGKTPGFTDVYGRLRWDMPSVTITAKSSTPSCGRFLHPEQHRNISVREAAILQGFPQSYRFTGGLVSRYRQIGEAVPALFARFLAWQILDNLRTAPKVQIEFKAMPSDRRLTSSRGGVSVVDCFCGAGGLALGFEAAGYDTAFAFDIDPDAVATFNHNISNRAVVGSVVDKVIPEQIAERVKGKKYVVVGGPPCQGFSQQRRGDDKDPRNNLVLRYADLVSSLDPAPLAVVLENVTYLDSPRGAQILSKYVDRMKELGYEIYREDLHSADFGVAQLRHRIVIVALRKSRAKRYHGIEAITGDRWLTVGEVLQSLPDLSNGPILLAPSNHEPSIEGSRNKQRIAFVDMGKGRLSIPNELQLECHRAYGGHLDVYGRLDWFSQARTITGGFDSFTRGEFAHPFLHRSITPREGARIQGFPDWFTFTGNRASLRRQIGNAVPPPMAYAIALGILKAIL